MPVYPESELWCPLRRDLYSEDRSSHYLRVVGRVRSGLDIEQARAEMATIMARLELEYPEHNADTGVNVVPLRDYVVGDVSRALFILLGAVGFVLRDKRRLGRLVARLAASRGDSWTNRSQTSSKSAPSSWLANSCGWLAANSSSSGSTGMARLLCFPRGQHQHFGCRES